MAATFTSTQPGTSSDYMRYVYENPVKTDRVGDVDLLDFALAPTDASFVKLKRGAYISINTSTYGTWFTGYVSNDPEYVYLGKDTQTKQPVWGFRYQAESDEAILNEQSIGIIPPFLNRTQGQILASLAQTLLPGFFDTSNIQPGLFLARYQVDPTKKFADIVKEFTQNAVYRFWGKSGKLYFSSQDAQPSSTIIDPTNQDFSPDQLDIRASKIDIVNDAVVIGGIEPQDYVSEYFVGDGFTGSFPLMESVYGVESALLLDETFQGGSLNSSNWTVYDLPSPKLQLSNGFLNVLGGTQDGNFNVHLDSANLIPIEGSLRLTHGDFDFVDAATTTGIVGVVGGVWTQAPNSALTGCVCGLAVNRDANDHLTLQIVLNGAIVNASYQPINLLKRYVLRTVLSSPSLYFNSQGYSYQDPTGTVMTVGGPGNGYAYTDNLSATFIVSEIDPVYGMLTDITTYPRYATYRGSIAPGTYGLYVPAASSDLHCSITNITVSTPIQGTLSIEPKGASGYTQKLIGPNEVDALDGMTPAATITQSGGVTQQSSTLGTPQYAASNPTLAFFKNTVTRTDTIPGVADTVCLNYRSAGAAVGRARDNNSVALEAANWGDSGIRSKTNNSASPQPRTSADCEAAAAAIVNEWGHTRFEGTYKVWSDYTTSEPVAGTILPFQNMDVNSFGFAYFGESIYQVKTTFVSAKPHELFLHEISFGKATDQEQLRKTLARFQNQPDTFFPQDSASVPGYVLSSSIGLAYASDVQYLSLVSFDANNFYVTSPNPPPTGGGLEVRSTNDSWGADNGKNLVTRSSTQTFSVPRNQHNKVAFVRAYDARNYLLYSEDLTQSPWSVSGPNHMTKVTAVNPNGGLGSICSVSLAASGGSVVSQSVAIPSSSSNGAFSISLKGTRGHNVTVQMVNSSGTPWGYQTVQCTGEWQRVTVPSIGSNGTGTGPYGTGVYSYGTFSGGSGTSAGAFTGTVYCQVLTHDTEANQVQLTFASLEFGTLTETVYAKTNATIYGAVSRYSSAVRFNFPLIPPPPLTVAVNPAFPGQATGTDPTVQPGVANSGMLVTPTMPLVGEDVWGFEIRDADNTTVLYHCDLTSSSYKPTVTLPQVIRNPTYYVYTYNLFGEYSAPYVASPSLSPPTVSSLVVNDTTGLLLWQFTNATYFTVIADSVDETFTHQTFNITVSDNFLALQDTDFYPFRWFRVIPWDALGSGAAVDISHQYAPGYVDPIGPTQVTTGLTGGYPPARGGPVLPPGRAY